MKKYRNLVLTLTAAAFLVVGGLQAKESKDDAVARVVSVEGQKKFERLAAGSNDWKESKTDAAGYIKDHFRTDTATSAALELRIGGRIGVKEGSEIVLLSEGGAGSVEDGKVKTIELKKGGMWAKFAKQDGRTLNVKTKGGVMGIKGTEFFVDSDDESGETEISLVEGSVVYQEADENGEVTGDLGEASEDQEGVYVMEPGEKLVQFNKDGNLHVVTGAPDEVDQAVANFLSGATPIGDLVNVRNRLKDNFRNLDEAAKNAAISAIRGDRTAGFGGIAGSLTNWQPRIPNWGSWVPYVPQIPNVSIPHWP